MCRTNFAGKNGALSLLIMVFLFEEKGAEHMKHLRDSSAELTRNDFRRFAPGEQRSRHGRRTPLSIWQESSSTEAEEEKSEEIHL